MASMVSWVSSLNKKVHLVGRLSLISLLTNLLILPVQPPIMLLGGLATLAGMLWLPLGQIVSWLVWMVELTASLPYASLDLGGFPLWLLAVMYTAIAAGIWWANRPTEEKETIPHFHLPEIGSTTTRLWVGGAGVVALLAWLAVATLPDGRLHVAFLDVGQGDAILVTTPDGRQLLIDGGPSATDLNWRLGQEMPFWDRKLELVVNTHPDNDHLGGLVSLLERYRVEQALVSDLAIDSQLYQEWDKELAEAELTPVIGQAGQQLELGGGVTATVLNPGPASAGLDDPNDHSVVLHLQFGQISFLLPGDIEAPVEQKLVASGVLLTATVLKSPHHGSRTSSSEPFLAAVKPQVVVISVGAENSFGHPTPEVMERYAAFGLPVLRTDERGTIEFSTDGERLLVATSR